MAKEIECRDCKILFDAEHPNHKSVGYYNQCADCAEETEDVKIKALTSYTPEGDWAGIDLVTTEQLNKLRDLESNVGTFFSNRRPPKDE